MRTSILLKGEPKIKTVDGEKKGQLLDWRQKHLKTGTALEPTKIESGCIKP